MITNKFGTVLGKKWEKLYESWSRDWIKGEINKIMHHLRSDTAQNTTHLHWKGNKLNSLLRLNQYKLSISREEEFVSSC